MATQKIIPGDHGYCDQDVGCELRSAGAKGLCPLADTIDYASLTTDLPAAYNQLVQALHYLTTADPDQSLNRDELRQGILDALAPTAG